MSGGQPTITKGSHGELISNIKNKRQLKQEIRAFIHMAIPLDTGLTKSLKSVDIMSDPKLFNTLMVFLKVYFEKVNIG